MQILVNIDDNLFNRIKYLEPKASTMLDELMRAVQNGIPLPKGHGRLGDLDALKNEVSSWGMNDYEPSDFTDAIDDAPTVEAIPKADYEARLKADLVAVLEEISLKFDEQYYINRHELHDDSLNRGLEQGQDIIQEKINALKGEEGG